MNTRKVFGAILASCALVFSLSALTGCADNSEQVIRDGINQQISEIKSMEGASIESAKAELPTAELEQLGVNSDAVLESALSGFDGTVDSVTVNGKTAEAVVTFTSKNLSNLEEDIYGLTDEIMEDPQQFANMSEEEIYAWCGQKMMELIDQAPVQTHEPITLDFELNGNTWEMTSASEKELSGMIFGGATA